MAVLETEIQTDLVLGRRSVQKIVNDSEKAGEKSGEAFEDGFKESARNLGASFKSVFGSIARSAAQLGAVVGSIAFGLAFRQSIREASNLEQSLIGLRSVAAGLGADVNEVENAAKRLASDGLVPLEDVSASLRVLLANFNGDLEKSVQVFDAFRNAAAFNRQGTLALGEAIRGASEGLKNDNSIKVDNAGITKNLSVIQKEYAAELGTTVGRLTEAQKTQAEYVGIVREAALFQGDYNALLNTFSGATTRASTSFRFLLAEFGRLLTQSPAIVATFNFIADSLNQVTRNLASAGTGDIGRTIIQGFIDIGRSINEFVIEPFVILGRVGGVVFRSLTTGLAAITNGFAQLGAAVGFVLERVGLGGQLTQSLAEFSEATNTVLIEQSQALNEALTGIFDPVSFSEKTTLFLEQLQQTIDTAVPIVQTFESQVGSSIDNAVKSFDRGAKQINAAISGALARGLSSTIQKLAGNLAAGKALFSDFGKFLLGLLGDVLIQVGQAAIAFGITITAIEGLQGPQAIAAGAALVAIGTLIKGLSGGAGGLGGSISGAQGGFAPSVGAGQPPDGTTELEEDPQSTVTINIEGNVLDSDETGLRIAEILRNSVNNEDVQIIGGVV